MHLLYTLMLSLFCSQFNLSPIHFSPSKVIIITLNEKGKVKIDGVTIEYDLVAKELQQRLWRGYMTTGVMARSIQLETDINTPDIRKKEIREAIKEAQGKTITILCLYKFKNRFDQISTRKQAKIKKQFPVLFQQFN